MLSLKSRASVFFITYRKEENQQWALLDTTILCNLSCSLNNFDLIELFTDECNCQFSNILCSTNRSNSGQRFCPKPAIFWFAFEMCVIQTHGTILYFIISQTFNLLKPKFILTIIHFQIRNLPKWTIDCSVGWSLHGRIPFNLDTETIVDWSKVWKVHIWDQSSNWVQIVLKFHILGWLSKKG